MGKTQDLGGMLGVCLEGFGGHLVVFVEVFGGHLEVFSEVCRCNIPYTNLCKNQKKS